MCLPKGELCGFGIMYCASGQKPAWGVACIKASLILRKKIHRNELFNLMGQENILAMTFTLVSALFLRELRHHSIK